MHRCLTTLDILFIIFEYQDIENYDLACLATTCRTFSGPALDILWREQKELPVLLKSMSSDLWGTLQLDDGSTRLELQRPITDDDWQRFKFYADRMRTLQLFSSLEGDIDSWDSSALLASAPGLPVLRNIKTLEVEVRAPDGVLLCLRLLSGRSIVSLRLFLGLSSGADEGAPFSEMGGSCLHKIQAECPNVRALFCDRYTIPWPTTINRNWPDLESFVSGLLSAEALLDLSTFRSLSMLQFEWDGCEEEEETLSEDVHTQDRFPVLRSLHLGLIGYTTIRSALPILDLAKWSRLEELDIACYPALPPLYVPDWAPLTQMLRSTCSHTVLKSITLRDDACFPSTQPGPILLEMRVLEPLLSFGRLLELSCRTFHVFHLGDADVAKMARAWPSLRKLHLYTDYSRPYRMIPIKSKITVHGLASLVCGCPDLQDLSIVIDATTATASSTDGLMSSAANHKVTYLDLQNSTISDPTAVAAIFSVILPSLRDIRYLNGDVSDNDMSPAANDLRRCARQWEEVAALLVAGAQRADQERP
ncbi:hypothetical protein PLICRDRAFT_49209 [Plicaturopsis crispa FD-325 SS-3]|nr:hypothetical protein PLICRDRAFT_49209 [Plicaturopsis crispa FD-325 SS-3]